MIDIYISPHFDDLIFSLSYHLINNPNPKITIITIFTKENHNFEYLSGDYKLYGDMKTRNTENIDAINRLSFKKKCKINLINLELDDKLFRKKTDNETENEIISKLKNIIGDDDNIYCPLGIGNHPDHISCFNAIKRIQNKNKFYYFDFPYSSITLNTSYRLNQLNINIDEFKNTNVKDYYTNSIYNSTFFILRIIRIINIIISNKVYRLLNLNSIKENNIIKLTGDLEDKYDLCCYYKTQINPIFGSLNNLKNIICNNNYEYLIKFNEK